MAAEKPAETELIKQQKRLHRRPVATKSKRRVIPRSISPLSGGTAGSVPGLTVRHDSSLTLEYGRGTLPVRYARFVAELELVAVKILFPGLLPAQPSAVSDWIAAICNSKANHHGVHWATAVHRDIRQNRIEFTASPWAIRHKMQCMKELRMGLNRKDFCTSHDRDLLLLTVVCLWSNEINDNTLVPGHRLNFSPHMPTVNWTAVYGRMDYVEAHAVALINLVNQIGGLQNIKIDGLASTIALGDLLQASRWNRRPCFPRIWQYNSTVLGSRFLLNTHAGVPGRGFFITLPGVLPSAALATYVRLAALDRRLERWRKDPTQTSERGFQSVTETRNALHHDLLSLLPWREVEEQSSTSEAVYECCRLAALIYSNGVIMAVPTNSGWPLRLAEQLHNYLQLAEDLAYADCYLWALHVGGLVSLGTRLWPAYQNAMRRASIQAPWAWQKIDMVLEQFLWSSLACSRGLALLRQSL